MCCFKKTVVSKKCCFQKRTANIATKSWQRIANTVLFLEDSKKVFKKLQTSRKDLAHPRTMANTTLHEPLRHTKSTRNGCGSKPTGTGTFSGDERFVPRTEWFQLPLGVGAQSISAEEQMCCAFGFLGLLLLCLVFF